MDTHDTSNPLLRLDSSQQSAYLRHAISKTAQCHWSTTNVLLVVRKIQWKWSHWKFCSIL